ncbi:AAA family ATPase [Mucilaginibacter hurinus]|uniref:AAA family ATPase n=2 Tax=Mucilaginibacter hurinus TaxID=2201324 RepID=A0A367GUX6_9SPHI|nr:AAA family ATPase [Mucilaginibacter hurinus]
MHGQNRQVSEYYISYGMRVRQYQEALSSQPQPLLYPKVLKAAQHRLFDEYAAALYRFASLVTNLDNAGPGDTTAQLQTVWRLTHTPEQPADMHNGPAGNDEDDKQTLEDVIRELELLIGLDDVKKEVTTLVNFIKIQKEREKAGLNISRVSYHCVFTGAPGTGKTTVARLLARIYKKLSVIKKGHLIEADRSSLVAEYAGQTAVKVDKVVQSALDGVLFIDEAYALIGENNDNYGQEAVATLIKRMEDHRDRLIVIVAGYPEEMENFINDNPGLKSRFNRYIEFKDYSTKELLNIYRTFCTKTDYKLTKQASAKLRKYFNEKIANKDKSFGNGRLSRNVFEKSIEQQANRLSLSSTPLTRDILLTIEAQDIPQP